MIICFVVVILTLAITVAAWRRRRSYLKTQTLKPNAKSKQFFNQDGARNRLFFQGDVIASFLSVLSVNSIVVCFCLMLHAVLFFCFQSFRFSERSTPRVPMIFFLIMPSSTFFIFYETQWAAT
jgi:hypothetical protein